MPADRRDVRVQQRLSERRFGDADVVALLEDMGLPELEYSLGHPVVTITVAQPRGHWRAGDGRPILADDDPAVMQAIGRCAASRIRGDVADVLRAVGRIHPGPCGWCAFPLEELLAACDWAVWHSRYVIAELATWSGWEGSTYTRELRAGVYDNPRWRDWWALPAKERGHLVDHMQAGASA